MEIKPPNPEPGEERIGDEPEAPRPPVEPPEKIEEEEATPTPWRRRYPRPLR